MHDGRHGEEHCTMYGYMYRAQQAFWGDLSRSPAGIEHSSTPLPRVIIIILRYSYPISQGHFHLPKHPHPILPPLLSPEIIPAIFNNSRSNS